VTYALHPEAALEHEQQVAYDEERQAGLGQRYHLAFLSAAARACESPLRFKVIRQPEIRGVGLPGFPFSLVFRPASNVVQVLAIAHPRKRPEYWAGRL